MPVGAELVVREGSPADLEPCFALARIAAAERSSEEWRASLAADVAEPERLLVVAERAGELVGYGRARLFAPSPDAPPHTAPGGYYLTGVFVRDGERRRGAGTALTQARLDWIAGRAPEAWFFTNARNSASIELHRRFGFEEISRTFSFPGLTFDGGEGILYRARLRLE